MQVLSEMPFGAPPVRTIKVRAAKVSDRSTACKVFGLGLSVTLGVWPQLLSFGSGDRLNYPGSEECAVSDGYLF